MCMFTLQDCSNFQSGDNTRSKSQTNKLDKTAVFGCVCGQISSAHFSLNMVKGIYLRCSSKIKYLIISKGNVFTITLIFTAFFFFVDRLSYTVFFNKLVEGNNQQLTIMYDIDLCTWSTLKSFPVFCPSRFFLQLAPVIHMQSIFTFYLILG